MDNLPKIECITEEIIKNKKTGYIYKDEDELKMDITVKPEDIQRDISVKVTNKGLNLMQKIMNKK